MCFAPQRRAIFHLSSGQLAPHPPLQRAYFSTLRSPKPLEKHSVSRLSYLFAHLHLLSSYSFFSDLLSSNLPLLSASALLCFSFVHIVGSLTSKLPSNIYIYYIYTCIYIYIDMIYILYLFYIHIIYIYIRVCVCACYVFLFIFTCI